MSNIGHWHQSMIFCVCTLTRSSFGNGNHILSLQGNGPCLGLNSSRSFEPSTDKALLDTIIEGCVFEQFEGIREFPSGTFRPMSANRNGMFLSPFFWGQIITGITLEILFLFLVHGSSAFSGRSRTILVDDLLLFFDAVIVVRVSSQALGFANVFRIVIQLLQLLGSLAFFTLGHGCRCSMSGVREKKLESNESLFSIELGRCLLCWKEIFRLFVKGGTIGWHSE